MCLPVSYAWNAHSTLIGQKRALGPLGLEFHTLCWEWNLSPLAEQPVILTARPSFLSSPYSLFYFILFYCVWMFCLYESTSTTTYLQYPQKPEEGIRSPTIGIKDSTMSTNAGEPRSSAWAARALHCWANPAAQHALTHRDRAHCYTQTVHLK